MARQEVEIYILLKVIIDLTNSKRSFLHNSAVCISKRGTEIRVIALSICK